MKLPACRALVSGASSGIGAATAVRLAGAGARVVLLGRDPDRLAEVARRAGGRTLVADLTTQDGLSRGCAAAAEAGLLVNNAGRGYAGAFAGMPPDEAAELIALDLTAPVQLARAALPAMRARGAGHLVFVSSIAAVGVADEAVYAAAKAGLRAFAASLRHEARADGVGVTTVLPGAVDTPFFSRRGRGYERATPRPVGADAVARAVVRGVQRERGEVFVPAWLSLPARVQGAAPAVFERMSRRFG